MSVGGGSTHGLDDLGETELLKATKLFVKELRGVYDE
jgi:hypothetical protein